MTPPPVVRWPGWDGWLVLGTMLVLVLLQVVRQVEGMGFPLLIAVVAAGAYLLFTATLRRSPRVPGPVHPLRILTVIPTKDNAGSIAEVVKGCLKHTNHLLVVDDGCVDGSGRLAGSAGATVVTHPANLGKGAAIETALDWASANGYSHIVCIDADGQHEPDDLPSFYAAIQAAPAAIIAGVRDMSAAPKAAAYARANSNFWVWVGCGRTLGDTQSGYRAFPVEPVRQLNLIPSRYQWEVEVLVRATWAGIPIVDHPCRVFYPPADERVSSYRKFVDTARISWLNAHLITERVLWPPRWFPASRAWQGGHRGFPAGWRLLFWVMRTFGRTTIQYALVPVVGFYWLFLGHQQHGVDSYLRRRVPEAGPFRRAILRFQLLLDFAWSIVDRFHALLPGPTHLELDRTSVPGLKDKLYDTDEALSQGVVMISGHLGNPDLAGVLLGGKSRQVHVLLYQTANDPYLDVLREAMGENAPNFIPINDGGRLATIGAIKALRAGDVLASKADRVVDGRVARVDFLGAPILIPTGPFLLAALAKVPVVFVGCFRTDRNTYRFEASGPHQLEFGNRGDREADLQHWAALWVRTLEDWTARYPTQWYNFFDPWEQASQQQDPPKAS